jgi:hypothetical protein
MPSVQVRYIVHGVDTAIAFDCGQLGFHEDIVTGEGGKLILVDDPSRN